MYFGNIRSHAHDNENFEDDSTRRHFISKVCSILAMQLAITAGITCIFVFIESPRHWLSEHGWLFYVAIGIYMILSLALFCCLSLARKVPINYILLILCTVAESIIVSVICLLYDPLKILSAVGITVAVCLILALFAAFAPCDFTGCGPFLCIFAIVLVLLGIVNIFIRDRTLIWIFVCAGILLFSMYIVYDIQMMVGGHKNEYSEEDYIIAALCLYIDVIQMFLFILMLLGLLDD
ncbi:protein lifeguard 1 [Drosophila innubila]|uniref:protein lifeguard 1 n=1 Tax=Drosophila innubila TaxID=198719 RepID=UPI00148CA31D|nr:protein lifeguard 1 [Drosophila innubila]